MLFPKQGNSFYERSSIHPDSASSRKPSALALGSGGRGMAEIVVSQGRRTMGRRWNFFKSDPEKTPNDLETDTELRSPGNALVAGADQAGQKGLWLWFSLQLSRDSARKSFATHLPARIGVTLATLIHAGAQMAPASYTALRFAIAAASPEAAHLGPDPDGPDAGYRPARPTGGLRGASKARRAGVGSWKSPMPGSRSTECRTACPINPVAPGTPSSRLLGRRRPLSCVVKGSQPSSGPVIIAMIDDGVGIANDRFRDTAITTRIKHFLDLSSPARRRGGQGHGRIAGLELDKEAD